MAPKKKRAAGPQIDPNSSLTPESFEKELKALAAKAGEETWSKAFREQAAVYVKSLPLLALVAVSANVSQLALSPVYGSIPSAAWHPRLVMAACFIGWSSNLYLRRMLSFNPVLLLPVIAIYVPAAQFYLYKFSGTLTARWGPLVTEGLTLLPLMAVAVACVASHLENADFSRLPRWLGDSMPGLGSWGFYKLVERMSARLIEDHVGRSFLQTRIGMELVLAASYTLLAPSKLLFYAIPALVHLAAFNVHAPTPMALQSVNKTLKADKWMILDRKESVTGYMSVVENHNQGFRVMRCDHSLLGGEWVNFKSDPVAEPIYGVFVMLEAVRLVEVPEKVRDEDAKGLVIGLGIGTAPGALVAHGIDTTVVEIDPVVHEFAAKYFNLPSKINTVIQDAVSYTAWLANDTDGQRFDYIIHDVFTGGAEPIPLFTLEFLQSLNALLKPNGVIAINYAGDFALTPIKAVVHTIREVFPSCRIFREMSKVEVKSDEGGPDFTNVVIFCTKTSNKVTFRSPVEADMLNSQTRHHFLLPRHEVLDSDFSSQEEARLVRNNDTEQLAKYHEESARGHWTLMRRVVPPNVWELW